MVKNEKIIVNEYLEEWPEVSDGEVRYNMYVDIGSDFDTLPSGEKIPVSDFLIVPYILKRIVDDSNVTYVWKLSRRLLGDVFDFKVIDNFDAAAVRHGDR